MFSKLVSGVFKESALRPILSSSRKVNIFIILICIIVFIQFLPKSKANMIQSARIGEIFNPCHNLDMFITSVSPERFLCSGQLAVPGHKSLRQFKNVDHIS